MCLPGQFMPSQLPFIAWLLRNFPTQRKVFAVPEANFHTRQGRHIAAANDRRPPRNEVPRPTRKGSGRPTATNREGCPCQWSEFDI
jgi:hypothetical protein